MAQRPLIAITGPEKLISWGYLAAAMAVRRAGGKPLRLTPARELLPGESPDAVIIGGGDDIDPALYGYDSYEPPDPERDAFEMRMLEYAAERELPVLGICRGAQLLNVVHGGNLYSDIRPLRQHTSNRPTIFARKRIVIQPGTALARHSEATQLRVNSLHYQAVNRLGHGFRVAARDRDNIIQAIERTGPRFCLGLQWHPEYLLYRRSEANLFKALVDAAS